MPDEKNTGNTETPEDAPAKGWETTLAGLSDAQRAEYDTYTHGLTSALDTLKTEKKDLKNALKALKGAKGAERDAALEEIQAALAEAERKNTFHDSCPPEITNRRAARALAQEYKCIQADGKLDVDKFREECPGQFSTKPATPGYGGTGKNTLSAPRGKFDRINKALRR